MPIRSRTCPCADERASGAPSTVTANVESLGGLIALVEGVDPFLDAGCWPGRAGCRRRRSAGRSCTRRCRRPWRRSTTWSSSVSRGGVRARIDVGDAAIWRRTRLGGGGPPSSRGDRRSGAGRIRRSTRRSAQAVTMRATAARDRIGLRMAQPPCWEPGETPGRRGRGRRGGTRRSRCGATSAPSGRRGDAARGGFRVQGRRGRWAAGQARMSVRPRPRRRGPCPPSPTRGRACGRRSVG